MGGAQFSSVEVEYRLSPNAEDKLMCHSIHRPEIIRGQAC